MENNLRNTTKLVSQFLEFKCIFYGFYKFGLCCCDTAKSPRIRADSPPVKTYARGSFHWDEHWHRRTVRENDGPSGKHNEQLGCKNIGDDSRGIGVQIECGLFVWLSSDVGKLQQVLDVTCMVCVELDPIHGGGGHG